jgi:hypothetical protein
MRELPGVRKRIPGESQIDQEWSGNTTCVPPDYVFVFSLTLIDKSKNIALKSWLGYPGLQRIIRWKEAVRVLVILCICPSSLQKGTRWNLLLFVIAHWTREEFLNVGLTINWMWSHVIW